VVLASRRFLGKYATLFGEVVMRRYLLGLLGLGVVALGCAKAEPVLNEEPAPVGGSGGGGGTEAGAAGSDAGGAGGESGAAGEGGAAGDGAAGQGGAESEGGAAGSSAGAGGAAAGDGGAAGVAGDGGTAGAGGEPPKPCPNKPIINELMTAREEGGKVDEKYEFIELLAVGDDDTCAISLLDGYKLFRDSSEVWGGAASPGFKKGKRFVLGGETYSADGKPTDQGLPQPSFPAAGACIELRKDGAIVDRFCYGSGASQAPVPAPGKSVGRSPDGVDTDSDKDDFVTFDQTTPNAKNP
jgi:hypothetical protein